MLFYIKCPTCSRFISEGLDTFHIELDEIRDDPNLTVKQKDERYSALLDKYGFDKICCRIRIMGLIPYHKIILT